AYLHKIKKVNMPIFQQSQVAPETTMHYFLLCSKFERQRIRLRQDLKSTRELDMSILGEKRNLPVIFKYINATERFQDTHRDLILQTEETTSS
ncbi:hypothetical protein BYT27DRAFT_7125760, partial [Phlegmacium glaucopus]